VVGTFEMRKDVSTMQQITQQTENIAQYSCRPLAKAQQTHCAAITVNSHFALLAEFAA